MKFLVDMPLSPKTVSFLINLGYEAIRVRELGMAKSKDKEIFNYASEQDMVILSADLDFGNILAYTQSIKPSVVIFRLRDPCPEHVNSLLSSNLPIIYDDLMEGSIVIIEDFEIRIRKLPILKEE
jgi:predicted nuclease of predicted toxin-antitoxin system